MGPEKGLYTDLDTAASSEPLVLVPGQLPRFHAVDRIVVGDGASRLTGSAEMYTFFRFNHAPLQITVVICVHAQIDITEWERTSFPQPFVQKVDAGNGHETQWS